MLFVDRDDSDGDDDDEEEEEEEEEEDMETGKDEVGTTAYFYHLIGCFLCDVIVSLRPRNFV